MKRHTHEEKVEKFFSHGSKSGLSKKAVFYPLAFGPIKNMIIMKQPETCWIYY